MRSLSKKKKTKDEKSKKQHGKNQNQQQHLGKVGKAKSRRKRIKMIMTRKRKNIPLSKNFADLLGITEESGSGSGDGDDSDPLNERSLIAIIPAPESDESGNSQDPNSGVASSQDPNSGVVEMSYENTDPQSSSDLLAKKMVRQSNGTKKSSFKLNVKNYFPKRLILENIRHQKSHPAGKRDHIETTSDDLDLDEDDFTNDNDDELDFEDEDSEPATGRSTVAKKDPQQQDDLMKLSSKFQHPNFVESSVKYRNVTCCEQSAKDPNFKQNCCSKRSKIAKQHDVSCCKNLKVTWGGVDLAPPPAGLPGIPPAVYPGPMESAAINPFNMTTGMIPQPGDIGIVGGMEVYPISPDSVPPINLAAPGPVSLADVVKTGQEMTKATNKMKEQSSAKPAMPPTPTPSGHKTTDAPPTWINFSLNPSKGVAVHPIPPKTHNKNKNNSAGGGKDEDDDDKDVKVVWGSFDGITTTPTPNKYENSSSNNKGPGDFKIHGTTISVNQPSSSGNGNKPNPIKPTIDEDNTQNGADSGKYGNKDKSSDKEDSEKGHNTKETGGQKKPTDNGPGITNRPGVNNKQSKGDSSGNKENGQSSSSGKDGKDDSSKNNNGPSGASKDSNDKGKGGGSSPTESHAPPPSLPPISPPSSQGNKDNSKGSTSDNNNNKVGKKINGNTKESQEDKAKGATNSNGGSPGSKVGGSGGKAGLGNSEESKPAGGQLSSPVPTKTQKDKNNKSDKNGKSSESLSDKEEDKQDENVVVSIPKANEKEKDKPTTAIPSKQKVDKEHSGKPALPTARIDSKEQEKSGSGSISTATGSKGKQTSSLQSTSSNSQSSNSQSSSPSSGTNANQVPSGTNLPSSQSANIHNNGNQNKGSPLSTNDGNHLNQLASSPTATQVQTGQNLPNAQPVAGAASAGNNKAPTKLGSSETATTSNGKNKEQPDNIPDQTDDNDSGVSPLKGSPSTNIKIPSENNNKNLKEGASTKTGKKPNKETDRVKQNSNPSLNKITPATTLQPPVITTTEKSSSTKQKEGGSNTDSEEDEDIEDAITNANTNTPTQPHTQPTTTPVATTPKPKTTTTPALSQPGVGGGNSGAGSPQGSPQGTGGAAQGTTSGKQKKPASTSSGSKKPNKKPSASQQGGNNKEEKTKTTVAPTILYTRTSFKIICLPINWPCTNDQKLTTVAPSYNPSNTNDNKNNNAEDSSKDLQNGGNGSTSDVAAGKPAPVPFLFEESENKNKTIVAQPVLPLVPMDGCTGASCLPMNGCTGTSCVPPSPPFNCIPGFPCPIEDLNIIDPLHPTKTPPPPGLPAKIKVWALETVETHVKNGPGIQVSISPTSQTTTAMVSSNGEPVLGQPTQPQSKTPVPGPVEFPNFPPGVDAPSYQQVALPQQESIKAKDSTPKTQDTITFNPSLNIQGPTVLETTTYQQNTTAGDQLVSSHHPAVGVQGPQNQYNTDTESQGEPIRAASSNPDGSSNTAYQYAGTPLPPGETTVPTEQPPQFNIINLGTENTTTAAPPSSTVKTIAIEAKDDGHVAAVPPPDFYGNEDKTTTATTTTSAPSTTPNPYLPVENPQQDESSATTPLPFATISTSTPTTVLTTTTYQPVEIYPNGETSSKF